MLCPVSSYCLMIALCLQILLIGRYGNAIRGLVDRKCLTVSSDSDLKLTRYQGALLD